MASCRKLNLCVQTLHALLILAPPPPALVRALVTVGAVQGVSGCIRRCV